MLVGANVSSRFEGFLIIYIFLALSYTYFFKNIPLLDIFIVAVLFLVRVLAGGEAFGVPVSGWLFLTVFIVSLFLAAGKRLGEMTLLGVDASKHRSILASYSPTFLEGVLWMCAAIAVVMYALYTIENRRELIYTVPMAVYGFFRYLYILKKFDTSDPTDMLFRDAQLLITGVVWLSTVAYIAYR
jgi:4-hydroxybenzoate polyprenyltransferase